MFTITDEGKGLDPDTLPDPLAPENLLRGTGRGIFLIRSFMDEVHFRQLHPGTELTLVKHLAPAERTNLRHDARPNRGRSVAVGPCKFARVPFNDWPLQRCYNRNDSKKEEFPWHLLLLPVKWTA